MGAYDQARQQVVETAQQLTRKGFLMATGGNLSLRVADQKAIAITPSNYDYMKMVPDQIAPWVPGGLMSLGTDGFGRSEDRESLRRFFEVDAENIALAAVAELARAGRYPQAKLPAAIKDLGLDPNKPNPMIS